MLIEKEVFDRINTINKNLKKLSKYKTHSYNNGQHGTILIKSLTNDLAYIVGKINKTYETFLDIVNQQLDQKD